MNEPTRDTTSPDSFDRRTFVGTLSVLGATALAGCPDDDPEDDDVDRETPPLEDGDEEELPGEETPGGDETPEDDGTREDDETPEGDGGTPEEDDEAVDDEDQDTPTPEE